MLGHGLTDRPVQTYTLDHFADHIVALLDTVGAQEVYLSGESLGAMVAGWLAIKYPSRVKKVLFNTGLLSRPNAAGMAALDDLENRTNDLADLTIDAVRHRMAWLVSDPTRMSEEMVRIRYAIYSQPGMVDWMQKMLGDVLRIIRGHGDIDYLRPGVLGEIAAPTMVLWTDHNPGHDADQIRAHLDEFRCELEFVVMAGCGHWPQFEDPDRFNELILGFMRP
jgi:2-hydroxy-6-oxonona-2,4-dienedioate hydrolase